VVSFLCVAGGSRQTEAGERLPSVDGETGQILFWNRIPPAKGERERPDLSQEPKLSERSNGDEGSHRG